MLASSSSSGPPAACPRARSLARPPACLRCRLVWPNKGSAPCASRVLPPLGRLGSSSSSTTNSSAITGRPIMLAGCLAGSLVSCSLLLRSPSACELAGMSAAAVAGVAAPTTTPPPLGPVWRPHRTAPCTAAAQPARTLAREPARTQCAELARSQKETICALSPPPPCAARPRRRRRRRHKQRPAGSRAASVAGRTLLCPELYARHLCRVGNVAAAAAAAA